jgi:hypothetical protein
MKSTKFVGSFCKICGDLPLQEIRTLLFENTECESLFEETKRKKAEEEEIFKTMKTKNKPGQKYIIIWNLHCNVFKVLYWIIGYDNLNLLSNIIEVIRSKILRRNSQNGGMSCNESDISEIIFGTELESQNTCLTLACASGNRDMVNLVLDHVNLKAVNKKRNIALYLASFLGHHEVVTCLIKNGADVNLCDKNGVSPLRCASAYGHHEIVPCLIKNGADVNLCDNSSASHCVVHQTEVIMR